jgi:hypothetical protein
LPEEIAMTDNNDNTPLPVPALDTSEAVPIPTPEMKTTMDDQDLPLRAAEPVPTRVPLEPANRAVRKDETVRPEGWNTEGPAKEPMYKESLRPKGRMVDRQETKAYEGTKVVEEYRDKVESEDKAYFKQASPQRPRRFLMAEIVPMLTILLSELSDELDHKTEADQPEESFPSKMSAHAVVLELRLREEAESGRRQRDRIEKLEHQLRDQGRVLRQVRAYAQALRTQDEEYIAHQIHVILDDRADEAYQPVRPRPIQVDVSMENDVLRASRRAERDPFMAGIWPLGATDGRRAKMRPMKESPIPQGLGTSPSWVSDQADALIVEAAHLTAALLDGEIRPSPEVALLKMRLDACRIKLVSLLDHH